MYGLTVEQILKRTKISAVISLVITIVYLCVFFFGAFAGMAETGINGEITDYILQGILMAVIMPIIATWEIMAFILNWKKILKGILLPIPIISMIVEMIKGYVMAAKAIFYALKNKERK